jgi:hypothetical protein
LKLEIALLLPAMIQVLAAFYWERGNSFFQHVITEF